jgi:hypothetical protein
MPLSAPPSQTAPPTGSPPKRPARQAFPPFLPGPGFPLSGLEAPFELGTQAVKTLSLENQPNSAPALNPAVEQWLACANTLYNLPQPLQQTLRQQWQQHLPASLTQWYARFSADLAPNSTAKACLTPYTEVFVERLLGQLGLLPFCKPLPHSPGLLLSHSIGPLRPPWWERRLRQGLGQPKVQQAQRYANALTSLLQFNQSLVQAAAWQGGAYSPAETLLFVQGKYSSPNPLSWLQQGVQHDTHLEHNRPVALLLQQARIIGSPPSTGQPEHSLASALDLSAVALAPLGQPALLHEDTLAEAQVEWQQQFSPKKSKSALNSNAYSPYYRQLGRLPSLGQRYRMLQLGITHEASLAWPQQLGFRGGMARPFLLLVPSTQSSQALWQWQIPCPLHPLAFTSLGLEGGSHTQSEALKASQALLLQVLQRQGTISLDLPPHLLCQRVNGQPGFRFKYWYQRLLSWAFEAGLPPRAWPLLACTP